MYWRDLSLNNCENPAVEIFGSLKISRRYLLDQGLHQYIFVFIFVHPGVRTQYQVCSHVEQQLSDYVHTGLISGSSAILLLVVESSTDTSLTLSPHLSFTCLQRFRSTSTRSSPSIVRLRPGVRLPSGAAT